MFCRILLLFWRSDEKIRDSDAKFQAPEFFFRGLEFFFRGPDEKKPVQKRFRGGFGGVFLSCWNFFPDTFPVSFCRRNPPAGFPAGRTSAPGVSHVPSKGQVLRGIPRHFDFHEARVAAFFSRCPGPVAEYANLRRRK